MLKNLKARHPELKLGPIILVLVFMIVGSGYTYLKSPKVIYHQEKVVATVEGKKVKHRKNSRIYETKLKYVAADEEVFVTTIYGSRLYNQYKVGDELVMYLKTYRNHYSKEIKTDLFLKPSKEVE